MTKQFLKTLLKKILEQKKYKQKVKEFF